MVRSNFIERITVDLGGREILRLHHVELFEQGGVLSADELYEVVALHRHKGGLEVGPDVFGVGAEG